MTNVRKNRLIIKNRAWKTSADTGITVFSVIKFVYFTFTVLLVYCIIYELIRYNRLITYYYAVSAHNA